MISEKDLSELEKIPLDERITRVENLLKDKESPRPFELGLLLALKMGQEIREKKPLGSESGDLVASWSGKHPESVVEEAIAFAKEFLLNPAKIAEKIKAGLKGDERSEAQGANDKGESLPLASADDAASATPSSGDTPQRPESLDSEVENG
jgi:hypothetical protein